MILLRVAHQSFTDSVVHGGDGMMFVGYVPSPVDFAPADCQAKVQALLFSVGSGFGATHRRYDKSDIATGG
jgi:hypothetical protein